MTEVVDAPCALRSASIDFDPALWSGDDCRVIAEELAATTKAPTRRDRKSSTDEYSADRPGVLVRTKTPLERANFLESFDVHDV